MTKKAIWLLIGLAICLATVLASMYFQLYILAGLFAVMAIFITAMYGIEVDDKYHPERKEKKKKFDDDTFVAVHEFASCMIYQLENYKARFGAKELTCSNMINIVKNARTEFMKNNS